MLTPRLPSLRVVRMMIVAVWAAVAGYLTFSSRSLYIVESTIHMAGTAGQLRGRSSRPPGRASSERGGADELQVDGYTAPATPSAMHALQHELTTAREEALARERAHIDFLKQIRHAAATNLFRDELVPVSIASKLANDLVSSDLTRVHAALDKLQKQSNRAKATELRMSTASELESLHRHGHGRHSRGSASAARVQPRMLGKDVVLALAHDFFSPWPVHNDTADGIAGPSEGDPAAAVARADGKAPQGGRWWSRVRGIGRRWADLYTLFAQGAFDFATWVQLASERVDDELDTSAEVLEVHCGVNQSLDGLYAHLIDEVGNRYVLVSQKEATVTQDITLITDVALTLVLAAVASLVASACNLPVILGYLLAGALVGPGGLGLIHEFIQMESIAQFGVAFLLFHLGAEFDLSAVRAVQAVAVLGGLVQELLIVAFAVLLALAFGRRASAGVFLGCFLAMSSTAIVLRSLEDAQAKERTHGQIMLGILVMQDLSLGFILGVLPVLQSPAAALGNALLHTVLVLAIFTMVSLALHTLAMPAVLSAISSQPHVEVRVLGYVAICLVFAAISEALGVSIEMGSFIAGLTISARADRTYARQALALVEPIRDVFCAIFFTAIGMLVQPAFLVLHLPRIGALTLCVLALKFFVIAPSVLLFGYPLPVALFCGLGLSHVGEFSFVLAAKGKSYGLVSSEVRLRRARGRPCASRGPRASVAAPPCAPAAPLADALPRVRARAPTDTRRLGPAPPARTGAHAAARHDGDLAAHHAAAHRLLAPHAAQDPAAARAVVAAASAPVALHPAAGPRAAPRARAGRGERGHGVHAAAHRPAGRLARPHAVGGDALGQRRRPAAGGAVGRQLARPRRLRDREATLAKFGAARDVAVAVRAGAGARAEPCHGRCVGAARGRVALAPASRRPRRGEVARGPSAAGTVLTRATGCAASDSGITTIPRLADQFHQS